MLRNVLPAVAQRSVHLEKSALLLGTPRLLADGGTEMVIPPLSALLAGPPHPQAAFLELIGDAGPVLKPVLVNEAAYH